MAPSSSTKSPPPPPPSTHFTPIQEGEEDDGSVTTTNTTPTCNERGTPKPHSTPLHHKRHSKKRSECSSSSATRDEPFEDDMSVSCNKCRPNAREKISVVPVDNNNRTHHHHHNNNNGSSSVSMASPNGILKSIISSFKKSPKLPADREEKWKVAVAELSQKLVHATRKRDEAILEASRLKYSMAELEKKLNKLELYCHGLKSGLEECTNGNSPYQFGTTTTSSTKPIQNRRQSFNDNNKVVVDNFLVSVSEARTSVRLLSRSLTMQLRHMAGSKVYDKITSLLQPYDIKISLSKNPRSLLFYLEALLNKTFFDDFESSGFCKSSASQILNPAELCEANYASFNLLQALTWDEVLVKGTRHFSEDFSRFCDRKMSEIVAMLGWNRAWPEPLLQAFFGASKSVWLVHLLATSVHPSLPVFRVENGVGFDPVYMEDMGGDKAKKLVPSVVRIMVAPGFYVYGSVVKCKVLCRYNSNNNSTSVTQTSP